jgi:hypothetical protein
MLTAKGPEFEKKNVRGAKRAGIKYERDFSLMMSNSHPTYFPSQWVHFENETGWHWCQVDGILALPDAGILLVFECKLKHTYRSFYQLHDLYLPVLQFVFPHLKLVPITVVRHYDPAIYYPAKVKLMQDLHDYPSANQIGVYLWKK